MRARNRRRQWLVPYSVSTPDQFELNQLANHEQLKVVFQILSGSGGAAAGPDGVTYTDLSGSELHEILRGLAETLRQRTYRPGTDREVRIPKGQGKFRTLHIQSLLDRLVAKSLYLTLQPYWEKQLPGMRQDVWQIFAAMQSTMRREKAYFLAIDDIRDCFPSARIDDVLDCHRNHDNQPDLLWLIETVIRGHEGPDHKQGLAQGSPYSPVAMELLLHTHLDAPLKRDATRGTPLLLRYVDNLNIVCSSEREGHDILQTCRNRLAPLGFDLKGQDGPPQDIRDPKHSRTVLGLIPRWQNGQLTFLVPESAFDHLQEGLSSALVSSHPDQTAREVSSGWIQALGPALTNAARNEIIDRVIQMARKCGFTELLPKKLLEDGRQARQRWLTVSQEGG
ncbi:reverse transcriptase domain-containing protein [Maioricimonas sp. JC845]|uniref:reverse transcriptase domain-containing protein n=1 Tax=Maioricimonas sp. JC845 TaxID=3232138 RepID=UPI003457EABE